MAFSVFAAGTQTLLDMRGCLEREGERAGVGPVSVVSRPNYFLTEGSRSSYLVILSLSFTNRIRIMPTP